MSARKPSAAAVFHLGDLVLDPGSDWPTTLGIVTEIAESKLGGTVVWAHGGRQGGRWTAMQLAYREPRARVDVTPGMLGNRGWNREQAVKAALRHAGLVLDADGAETATPAGREAARRARG